MNEKVYVITESELDQLFIDKQTHALKTIYMIAKDNPNASWNELVMLSANELENPGSAAAPIVPEPEVEDIIEEVELVEEETLDLALEVEDEVTQEEENLLDEEDVTETDEEEEEDDDDIFATTEDEARISNFREKDNRVIRGASIFDE